MTRVAGVDPIYPQVIYSPIVRITNHCMFLILHALLNLATSRTIALNSLAGQTFKWHTEQLGGGVKATFSRTGMAGSGPARLRHKCRSQFTRSILWSSPSFREIDTTVWERLGWMCLWIMVTWVLCWIVVEKNDCVHFVLIFSLSLCWTAYLSFYSVNSFSVLMYFAWLLIFPHNKTLKTRKRTLLYQYSSEWNSVR